MKETIEWFSVTDRKRPDGDEKILMQLDDGDNQGVFQGFHTKGGFILTHGDYVSPSMWCYFPKGQQ